MRKKLKLKIIEQFDTQVNFARICGKNDNWISRIIQNRQSPTPEEKKTIEKVLKLKDVDSFLGE